jgi:hypothetical protein
MNSKVDVEKENYLDCFFVDNDLQYQLVEPVFVTLQEKLNDDFLR